MTSFGPDRNKRTDSDAESPTADTAPANVELATHADNIDLKETTIRSNHKTPETSPAIDLKDPIDIEGDARAAYRSAPNLLKGLIRSTSIFCCGLVGFTGGAIVSFATVGQYGFNTAKTQNSPGLAFVTSLAVIGITLATTSFGGSFGNWLTKGFAK